MSDEAVASPPLAEILNPKLDAPSDENKPATGKKGTEDTSLSDRLMLLLGIKLDDIRKPSDSVTAGAVASSAELKMLTDAATSIVGFPIDVSLFFGDLIEFGFSVDFSEELDTAGGFTVRSHEAEEPSEAFLQVSKLITVANEIIAASGTGREITMRRIGRGLVPIIRMISDSPRLKRLATVGTNVSNNLGVPPSLYQACSSIFPHIKSAQLWSQNETAAYQAHLRSVTKISESRSGPVFRDLRPNVESAIRYRDSGGDFNAVHTPPDSDGGGIRDEWRRIENMMSSRLGRGRGRPGLGHD